MCIKKRTNKDLAWQPLIQVNFHLTPFVHLTPFGQAEKKLIKKGKTGCWG